MYIHALSRLIVVVGLATPVILWYAPSNHLTAAEMSSVILPVRAILTNNGAALFNTHCALCHGKGGAGLPNWRAKGQPDFTKPEWQGAHTDAQIAEAIKNGEGKTMPAFKNKLSDKEVIALVSRIRELGRNKKK